jgi:hypothetical protein
VFCKNNYYLGAFAFVFSWYACLYMNTEMIAR